MKFLIIFQVILSISCASSNQDYCNGDFEAVSTKFGEKHLTNENKYITEGKTSIKRNKNSLFFELTVNGMKEDEFNFTIDSVKCEEELILFYCETKLSLTSVDESDEGQAILKKMVLAMNTVRKEIIFDYFAAKERLVLLDCNF